MPDYHAIINHEEEKALLTDMISIEEWVENVIHNKARQVIDLIVSNHANRNPKTLTWEEKLEIIRNLDLETAAERQARIEAEMLGA